MFVFARKKAVHDMALRLLAHVGETNPYDWMNRGPYTVDDVLDALVDRFGPIKDADFQLQITYH